MRTSERENLWLTAKGLLSADAYSAMWLRYAEDMPVREVAGALDKSQSWIYKRTTEASDPEERLPARRAHGQVVFTAGELRTWLRAHEQVIHGLPMTTTDSERRAFGVVSGGVA